MNFIEAFIVPHPYLFTLICIVLISSISDMFTSKHPSSSNDKDSSNDPTNYYR